METVNVLIYDTETSGLPRYDLPADDPAQPRLVELVALLCNADGYAIDSYASLVKPEGWTIEEGAAKVHGITTEIAREKGRPVLEVLDGFDVLAAKAGLLVAYNLRFDEKILRGERRRAGRPDGFGALPVFCCMKGATPLCRIPPTAKMIRSGIAERKPFKQPRLEEAVRLLLGREHAGAHRALADAEATRALYFKFRSDPAFREAGADFVSNRMGAP
jgi:DNA polymerase-3 subunit epsilon